MKRMKPRETAAPRLERVRAPPLAKVRSIGYTHSRCSYPGHYAKWSIRDLGRANTPNLDTKCYLPRCRTYVQSFVCPVHHLRERLGTPRGKILHRDAMASAGKAEVVKRDWVLERSCPVGFTEGLWEPSAGCW